MVVQTRWPESTKSPDAAVLITRELAISTANDKKMSIFTLNGNKSLTLVDIPGAATRRDDPMLPGTQQL